jgi:hypothetical protein
MLSQEFQLPFIQRKMSIMQKNKELPELPKTVSPQIVTGLEALGRGNDKNKLVNFIQTLGQFLGAEVVQKYVNIDDAISRLATADGIDTKGLVKTKEELMAEEQQQMMAMQQQQAMSKGIDVAGNVAGNVDPNSLDPQAIAEAINQAT